MRETTRHRCALESVWLASRGFPTQQQRNQGDAIAPRGCWPQLTDIAWSRALEWQVLDNGTELSFLAMNGFGTAQRTCNEAAGYVLHRVIATFFMLLLAFSGAVSASYLPTPRLGHGGSVLFIATALNDSVIVTGDDRGIIKVWDLPSGGLLRTINAHAEELAGLVVLPNTTELASASRDGTLRLWQLATGQLIREYGSKDDHYSIWSMALSQDGRELVAGTGEGTLLIYNVSTGAKIRSRPGHSGGPVLKAAIIRTKSGESVMSTGNDSSVEFWDLTTDKVTREVIDGYTFNTLAVSPDGTLAATVEGWYGSVYLWDVRKRKQVANWADEDSRPADVSSVFFAAKSSILFGFSSGAVEFFQANKCITPPFDDEPEVIFVKLSADETTGLMLDKKGKVRTWDCRTGRILAEMDTLADSVIALSTLPQNRSILSVAHSGGVRTWSLISGGLGKYVGIPGGQPTAVAISGDGLTLAAGNHKGQLTAWGLDDDLSRSKFSQGLSAAISSIALNENGTKVVAGTMKGAVASFTLASGAWHEDSTVPFIQDPSVNQFDDYAKNIALYKGWTIVAGHRSWWAQTSKMDDEIHRFQENGAWPVAIDQGSGIAYLGSYRLWKWRIGDIEEPQKFAWRPPGKVTAALATKNGKFLYVGLADGRIFRLDTANGMPTDFSGTSTGSEISSLAEVNSDRFLAVGGSDGAIRLYDAVSLKLALSFVFGIRAEDWLAVTPEGFFADGGDGAKLLSFVDGLKVYGGRDRYEALHRPDLIQTLLETSQGPQDLVGSQSRSVPSPFVVPQLGNTSSVTAAALSPDGRYILTSADQLRLWEANSGRLVRSLDIPGIITSVAFTPDGKSFATRDKNGRVNLWTFPGLENRFLWRTDAWPVGALAFAPDGSFLAVSDGGISFLDWKTGKTLQKSIEPFGMTTSIAAFPDSKSVVVGTGFNTIEIRTSQTGALVRKWDGHGSPGAVAISRDGKLIASGGDDREVRVWTTSGKLLRVLSGSGWNIDAISFSPDGKRIASGCSGVDDTIKVWDAETGILVHTLIGHSGGVTSLQFSSDGKALMSGGNDQTARIWDAESGSLVRTIQGTAKAVNGVAFSPDSRWFGSASEDGVVRQWAENSGALVRTFGGHETGASSVAFSPDGRRIASGADDGSIRIWDVDTGLLVRSLLGSKGVFSIAFSPSGKSLIVGSASKKVDLWDLTTGKLAGTSGQLPWWAKSVVFAPKGDVVAAAGETGVILLSPSDGQIVRELKNAYEPLSTKSLAFSRSGRWLVTGASSSGSAKLWDTATWGVVREFDGDGQVAVSPDEQFVVTGGGSDGTLKLFELQSGRLLRMLVGHAWYVNSVAFSPDGRLLISGSGDGTVRIWEVATGEELSQTIGIDQANSTTIGADGRFDSSNLEQIRALAWAMPDDRLRPLSPEIFMRDYYEPNLLGRLLACHEAEASGNADVCKEAFKPVRPLASLNRIQPDVRIVSVKSGPTPDVALVEVEASGKVDATQPNGKTSTGVYDVRLFRDGQIVGQWPEPRDNAATGDDLDAWRSTSRVEMAAGKIAARHVFPVRLAGADRGKKVTFTAYGFNEDRVKSATATDDGYAVPQDIAVPAKPHAYVVTVGVNEYESKALRLNFAAADAGAIETALQGIRGYDVVPVLLTSDYARKEGDKQIPAVDHATKADIRAVLDLLAGKGETERPRLRQEIGPVIDRLAKVTPDDLVVLAFSGHGHNQQGRFYILPSDSGNDLTKPGKLISSEELTAWLRDVDAGEMVMIVDACHSAAGVPAGFKPGPMGDRGLGQLAYDKGMRILAATQADDVALESGSLGQGLLTYALKEGLTAGTGAHMLADTDSDGAITMKEWLTYAETRVPGLYQDVLAGKIEKTKDSSPDPNLLEDTTRHAQTPALFDFVRGQAQNPVIAVH
ncbi:MULTISPECIES: caspase family protein [unclassified Mesorhizobium]|uniref:caspase family protein n=1 Tax=unclassified Mesorhizobium TaxID=325217 RepID=UPI0015E35DCC|nr:MULTISPECIES: caspase family protein [unclassified Mesorhizobium]MBZ9700534.1 caspase family protein [Mesorhizobium sp. CO1-1-3]MBZ9946470.1 caspase family protein [Mesorhizobium sp. BR1-1-11]